jgi:hypothetical protein
LAFSQIWGYLSF